MATSNDPLDDIAEAHDILVNLPLDDLDEHTAAWVMCALDPLDQIVLPENPGTNPAVLRRYTDPSRGPAGGPSAPGM